MKHIVYERFPLGNKVSPNVPRALVNALKDKKRVIGYYVWDEPYSNEQFTEARRQMDMLEELAPGDAVLLRVQDAKDEAFTCEYRLAK